MNNFQINEKSLSQLPAVQLLLQLGYTFISPTDALKERQNRRDNLLLEGVLEKQLRKLNRIEYKGNQFRFSEENIQTAVQKLKSVRYDGLIKTNEKVYDLLTLGTSLEQTIEGDTRSHSLHYVDWENYSRNAFHVTVEFSVERSRSTETIRPDLVLFVNGIPFAVIECKAPQVELAEGVSQMIRNQHEEFAPALFTFVQQVMVVNKNGATYATVGTDGEFWSRWKEPELAEDEKEYLRLQKILSRKVESEIITQVTSSLQCSAADWMDDRLVTEQDKSIYALCRPERLLEIAHKFTLFDFGQKKIARYQQYFVIKSTLKRVQRYDGEENRKGGLIWHTQGSGKSLTMVMLARNLALEKKIVNPRIVLVTDRESLDKQLGNTFKSCGYEVKRAKSGRNLLKLIQEGNASIITTLIHKFDKAQEINSKYSDDSRDIFVLVDESHRTQFGTFAGRMRQIFPRACYLGFTGTPLLKKEKNSFTRFGKLIDPHYSITQAVEDGAVVPLLYEARRVEITQNQEAVDLWFERHTEGLNEEQKADLKRKYARAEVLNKTDQVTYMRAFDISCHYRDNWQGSGFKAQLVAQSKENAVKFHRFLQEIGMVKSAVIISPPDNRESFKEINGGPSAPVLKFWDQMMKRYGSEEEYTTQLIDQFKSSEEPEILIVKDKLLTGFDAPKNTVIYLCRKLREHTLLQAIARVNRLSENKDYGYIVDYNSPSLLGELDEALTMYSAFEGFDESDIAGTMTSLLDVIGNLPQLHANLLELFNPVKDNPDEEAWEVFLADEELRDEFYERLYEYGKVLKMALSSDRFLAETNNRQIGRYKGDLKRFHGLKSSVKLRYAENIDFRDYEPKIRKLLDTHIQAHQVVRLNRPVNIFNEELFEDCIDEQGLKKSTAAQADRIAHKTKRVITQKMDEDPTFYQKFSVLIQSVIEEFRQNNITDVQYLEKIHDLQRRVIGKVRDEEYPQLLEGREDALACYGLLQEALKELQHQEKDQLLSEMALEIQDILLAHQKINFWEDEDAQKSVINQIDDYLYDEVKANRKIELSLEQMDLIIEKSMQLARNRSNTQ